jgi:hypothetical protein
MTLILILLNGFIALLSTFFWYFVIKHSWHLKSHLIKCFQFGYWGYLIIMATVYLSTFFACKLGMPLPGFFNWIWGVANFMICFIPVFLFVEVKRRKVQYSKSW